ncbi:MAG: sodium:solute symporter [Pseudomonadota bacterium]
MATTHRTRLVNPKLGIYFSIFSSLLISAFMLLLIFEQLGIANVIIRNAVLALILALFATIGIASYTNTVSEFFAGGRRVPAVYNGLVMAVVAVGGLGIITLTGLFFLNGFDVWCIVIGITTGFVLMGTMIAPFMRKYGGYTAPSYLGNRFDNQFVRIVSAAAFSVPMLLLLAAELQIADSAIGLLVNSTSTQSAAILAIFLAVTITVGGMRSLGWVGAAQAITVMLAIIVPAAMLGVIETNLPLAQLSYGPVLRSVGRMEFAQQIPIEQLSPLAVEWANSGFNAINERIAEPYTNIGSISFALTTLTVALGIASAPWLLPRCGTTIGVYEARKSLAWSVFFVGVIFLTLSALAVFLRNIVMLEIVGQSAETVPLWFQTLMASGQATISSTTSSLALSDITFDRDSIIFIIPAAAEFPTVILHLLLAGAIAATLAAIGSTVFSLSTMLTEDILFGLRRRSESLSGRVLAARISIVAVIVLAILFARVVTSDPLKLFFWSLSISAATAFPVIILSIWWKRMSDFAAIATTLTGFGVSILAIMTSNSSLIPIPSELIGTLGAFPAFAVAIVLSKIGSEPSRHVQDGVRDIRIPGGETIFDREQRLQRLKDRKTQQAG